MENYCKEVIIINKRQKKKYFKKKYGCNPSESIRISLTNSIAEIIKNNRDIWDRNINMSIGLGKTMQCVYEKILEKEFEENIKRLLN